jgi:predicted homoserine dehydrogenase-like protein
MAAVHSVRPRAVEALAERARAGEPVRVAIAGAGFLGRGLVNQLARSDGVRIVALADRHPEKMRSVVAGSGLAPAFRLADDAGGLALAEQNGVTGLTVEPRLLAEAAADVVVDCTGDALLGVELALACIGRKIAFLASAESDACFGPALSRAAAAAGAVYGTGAGDEHGEIVRLHGEVRRMGLDVVAAGKFKDFLDPHATPESVAPWAVRHGQNPHMLASFADGTKMSQEMAVVANATGLVPDRRGMHCPSATREEIPSLLSLRPAGVLSRGGVVEVVRGAQPSSAIFVVATTDHARVRADLAYLKMGDGPNHLFYKPYHLCALELAASVVDTVLTGAPTARAAPRAVASVFACAKRDLARGEQLDRLGGFTFFGRIDRAECVRAESLLPAGLAAGVRVVRPVARGSPIRLDDVEGDRHSAAWRLCMAAEPADA